MAHRDGDSVGARLTAAPHSETLDWSPIGGISHGAKSTRTSRVTHVPCHRVRYLLKRFKSKKLHNRPSFPAGSIGNRTPTTTNQNTGSRRDRDAIFYAVCGPADDKTGTKTVLQFPKHSTSPCIPAGNRRNTFPPFPLCPFPLRKSFFVSSQPIQISPAAVPHPNLPTEANPKKNIVSGKAHGIRRTVRAAPGRQQTRRMGKGLSCKTH